MHAVLRVDPVYYPVETRLAFEVHWIVDGTRLPTVGIFSVEKAVTYPDLAAYVGAANELASSFDYELTREVVPNLATARNAIDALVTRLTALACEPRAAN